MNPLTNIAETIQVAETRWGLPFKRKTAREASSSCPFCQDGVDRFLIFTNGRYWCRRCNKSGWIVGQQHTVYLPRCKPQPVRIVPPSPKWQERARHHLWHSQLTLVAKEYLYNRGLNDETILEFRLGYNRNSIRDAASLWGLEGKTIFLSQGILIPWFIDNEIWNLKVRRFQGKKYSSPRGWKVCLWGKFQGHKNLLLCEGEFDTMIAWQEVGHLIDIGTFGSVSVTPRGRWLEQLRNYKTVYVAYDMDDDVYKWKLNKLLGEDRVTVLTWEDANDLNDYYLAGGDIESLL